MPTTLVSGSAIKASSTDKDANQGFVFSVVDGQGTSHVVDPAHVAEALLGHMLKVVQAIDASYHFETVVMTVHSHFSQRERVATLKALQHTLRKLSVKGACQTAILEEPVAAIFSYLADTVVPDGTSFSTFDIGGGTTDLSVIKIMNGVVKVVAKADLPFFSGRGIDQAI